MIDQRKVRRYGKCLVEREIGRGARAVVYLAWHESLQIPVAVKVINKDNAEDDEHFSERFMREARIAAQLSHSHIVRVYDCGETEGEFYLVMEYVEGESCKDKMEQWGAFDWPGAVRIVRQVAEGLQYANRKGIIHRDIKPENIMIDTDGDARIADLGLAKQVIKGRGSATADGDVLGTPYYMSPEQVRQPSDVDFRSDIYSLGATLYHMASGEVPFEAPTPYEIMTKHLNEPLASPATKRPDLPQSLCNVVARCMAKDPQERYESYDELMKDLDAILAARPVVVAKEDVMASVEATLDDAPAAAKALVRAAAAGKQARAEPRLIRPVELPVTPRNVVTKVMGLLAIFLYAFWLAGVYSALLSSVGIAAALGAMLLILLASAGSGYLCARRGTEGSWPDGSAGLDEQLSAMLGRLCERLGLPTPAMRLTGRSDDASFCYTFFSRKAAIHIPARWLWRVASTDEERETVLAQSLAGVYAGDSDLRTLLAFPGALLHGGRWLFALLVRPVRFLKPLMQIRAARAVAATGLVALCAAIAALFSCSVWAGLLALLFAAVLLLTSAFERNARLVSDAFAVTVVENKAAVRSLIVAAGLAGPEGRRLLLESAGADMAARWPDRLPGRADRSEIVESVVSHYREVEYCPDTVEMAYKLFSVAPLAADRLNHLAGLPRRRSHLVAAVLLARRAYAALLGTKDRRAMCMADLADTGRYAALGAIGGLLTVAVVKVLALEGAAGYGSFIATAAVLGLALGLVIAPQAYREAASPGRLGWTVVISSVSYASTAMLGLCLFGWRALPRFAVHCPIGFVLVLALASCASAVFMRLAPRLGMQARRGASGAGSRTAHTVIMSYEEQLTSAKPGKAAAREPGAARSTEEPAGEE